MAHKHTRSFVKLFIGIRHYKNLYVGTRKIKTLRGRNEPDVQTREFEERQTPSFKQ
jgi:hypothetical protein